MTDATTPRIGGFIVMVPNHWGWSTTVEQAAVVCRDHGRVSVRKGKRAVFALPAGAIDPWVDDMGNIRWTWPEGVTPDRSDQGEWIEEPRR
jgi:hypothetical protein